jgi:hypothetical protein
MTGIHAFMTNQMKADLRACGFSEEQLHELTPQEGDEILAAANNIVPDSHEVRKFIEIIVAQARAATKHLKEPGLLQVSLLHPLSADMGPFYRYALDNPKLVEQMTKEIVSASESGHNTYLEARTIRRGLRGKKRGEAEDSVAVFASVVDSDADKGESWTPNVPVSLSVQTSPPSNEHSWLFWERALDFKTGQEFGARLRAATKTDKPTGNITQPYRIAGTVNYPSDKKKQRGRVNVGTRILNFDAKVLWTPEQFEQQYPKSNGGGPTEPDGDPQAPIWRIAKALAVIPHNDNDPHEADYWKQIGHTPGRTYMIQIGMAVKAASGGSAEGFEAFNKWRQGAPDYNADTTKKKWEGFHPTKIGFGTLKFYADKARPGWEAGDDPVLTAEVERLAKLSPVDYERERAETAKKLGMRASFLDKLVFKARARGKPKPQPGAPRDYMKSLSDLACNVGNILLALKQEAALKNAFGYDEMLHAEVLLRPLFNRDPNFKPRPATDADITAVQAWLQWYKFPGLGKDATHDAVNKYARDHAFHPVRDYLNALKWDGWPRLATWLPVYLGAEENKYTGGIGTMFLIGMVARIYEPGCKFDYMPIAEGGQGLYKSKACSILAGPQYFSDQLPDIKSKEASQHLRGKWLVEVAELSTYSRAAVDDFKAFLVRQVERYRPPWGRKEVHEPRQCAFIGTTNKHHYFRDETGNRRFWPTATGIIKLDELQRDRDQLFAEAVQLYRDHVHWWPDRDFELEHIAPEQENRYEPDVWEPLIKDYLDILHVPKQTTLINIAVNVLGYEIEPPLLNAQGQPEEARKTPINRLGPKEQGRIGTILSHLGWVPKRTSTKRWWEPKEE